jgi:Rrf2 family protein
MLKLSKKVEYGILALQYIANNSEQKASAREMSDMLNIPFEFLSKTLQQLMRNGLILSQKGPQGGYILSREPDKISIAEIIDALEEKSNLVECFDNKNEESCQRADDCTIRHNIGGLQQQINNVFAKMTIAEMILSNDDKLN